MTYIVYGSHKCPWCDKAKTLLESKDLPYKYLNVLEDTQAYEDITRMGHRTIPQVFSQETKGVDPVHIGGFEALVQHLKKTS